MLSTEQLETHREDFNIGGQAGIVVGDLWRLAELGVDQSQCLGLEGCGSALVPIVLVSSSGTLTLVVDLLVVVGECVDARAGHDAASCTNVVVPS